MKRIAILAAAAATLAVPAVFAQAVIVEGGPIILEGPAMSRPIAGAVIAESISTPAATVAVVPETTVLGGPAVVVPETTVLGAPAVVTSPSTSTVITHYWNVPADIQSRMDFQRWQRLL